MKKKDEPYGALLNALRTTSPILHRPEELTADIISRIESLPRKKNRYMLAGTWISGLAAMFLLCLLVKETIFPFAPERQRMAEIQGLKTEKILPQTIIYEKEWQGKGELSLSDIGRRISTLIRQQQDADARRELAIKKQIKSILK